MARLINSNSCIT